MTAIKEDRISKEILTLVLILGVAILMIGAVTEVRADTNVINYNTTTNGIHDWLKRPDGTFCMNEKSPTTIDAQKSYEIMKNKFGLTTFVLRINPWPQLCSTPEDQGNDYMNKVVNGENPTPQVIVPPSENTTENLNTVSIGLSKVELVALASAK